MYDRLAAAHEAGHCVVGAFCGLHHVATVRDDGSGLVSWDDGALSALHPFDRAAVALAGNVAEELVIRGNLKRAVKDTADNWGTNDAAILSMALSELAPEAWKYGQHGPAGEAAKAALAIIQDNRSEFNRLTAELMEYGVGQVRMGPRPPAPVDYSTNLAAVRQLANAKPVDLAELRNLATRAAADGNDKLAKLIEQTAARREGRAVEPVVEFSIGGPLKVVLQS